jgi:hypothetical protein
MRTFDRGLWVAAADSYYAWMDCAAADQGMLAPTKPGDGRAGPASSEDPNAILKPDHTLDIGDDCDSGSASPSPG